MNEAFPDMSCYTIHSKQSKEKNEAQLAAFMQAPTACIISVNMLGEGVHVDGVNFIVMLRRTQSPTVYFQQIGRCTKVGSDGEPVIFDIVGNRCTLRMIEVKKAEFLGLSRRAGEKKGGQFVLSSYLEDGLRVMILLMFCAGSRLPAPFVAPGALGVLFSGADFLSYLNMMSGSSLAQCTVFSLGVAPAINASIIMQLLCVAIPKWERYAKDDDGKKRIERYTQLCTLILAVVMAVGYYFIARNYGAVKYTAGFAGVLCGVIVVSVFAAGAMTVQWLGTLIDARGIGSGLSMLIFAGIVSRWSGTVSVIRQIAERVAAGQWGYMAVGVFLLAFMLASLLYAVCLNAAEKRIPVQYAGKNGNRGAGSFIPVRLVTGGVMPVIFAGSVLGIPSMISLFVSGEKHPSLYRALTAFARGNWLYILLYAVLIFAFHRFYLAIQFDSTEIATNLRKRGGMIPGVRPGKPTADYLNRAIKGMADSGSLALVLVACLPMLLSKAFGISLQLGGTSLLIVVGVAIELAGQVDSQLTIRHHDGFLD